MPERKAIERAHAAKRQGKAPSTQAGAFVKNEIDRVRAGKHGVRSTKQAVAIGLSEARRAGVDLKAPDKGKTSAATRKKAQKDVARGQHAKPAATNAESHSKRSRAATAALKRESTAPAAPRALAKQTHAAAGRRSAADRSAAARKGAKTKGAAGRSAAARKAAQTRAAHRAAH